MYVLVWPRYLGCLKVVTVDVSGVWTANDGGIYAIRHVGSELSCALPRREGFCHEH